MNKQNQHILLYLGLLLALFIVPNKLDATEQSLILKSTQVDINLTPGTTYFKDIGQSLDIDQIASDAFHPHFISPTSEKMNFGITESAYWFKIPIQNKTQETEFIFNIIAPNMDEIQFFQKTNIHHWKKVKTGGIHPFSSREIYTAGYKFNVHIPKNTKTTLFIKMKSRWYIQPELRLKSVLQDHYDTTLQSYFHMIMNTILLFSGMFSILFYTLNKHKAYFYQGFSAIFFSFTMLTKQGISFMIFWPNHPEFNFAAYLIFPHLFLLFLNFYVRQFIQITNNRPTYIFYLLNSIYLFIAISFFSWLFSFHILIEYSFMVALTITILSTFWIGMRYIPSSPSLRWFVFVFCLIWGLNISTAIIYVAGFMTYNTFSGLYCLGGTTAYIIALIAVFFHFQKLYIQQQRELATTALIEEEKNTYLFLSHEIRSSLGGMKSYLRFLTEGTECEEPQPQQKSYIEEINQHFSHMYRIANQILHFARINHTKSLKVHTPDQIYSVLRQSTASERSKLQNNVQLNESFPSINLDIKTDLESLRIIFINILSNAIKFTPSGTINILTQIDKETFQIVIEDSGIGIDEDKLERIFTLFQQASKADASRGFGIGLFMVKSLADKIGAQIEVESQKNSGTTFIVSIPSKDIPS